MLLFLSTSKVSTAAELVLHRSQKGKQGKLPWPNTICKYSAPNLSSPPPSHQHHHNLAL